MVRMKERRGFWIAIAEKETVLSRRSEIQLRRVACDARVTTSALSTVKTVHKAFLL